MHDLNICHLYPEHLNLYGDRGNMLAIRRMASWHGLNAKLTAVQPGERIDFDRCDLLFMGGGQDYEQRLVAADLKGRRGELIDAIDRGMVILAVCGSYQLLGSYYETPEGEPIPGLEILDLHTKAGNSRLIGNIVTECDLWNPPRTLVGFENHAGRTYIGPSLRPLGRVLHGHGNNGRDRTEGIVHNNVIGTYMHGSLLPKNPWLTDFLLEKALAYRGREFTPRELDQTMENRAHEAAIGFARSRRR